MKSTSSMTASVPNSSVAASSDTYQAPKHAQDKRTLRHAHTLPLTHAQYRSMSTFPLSAASQALHKDMRHSSYLRSAPMSLSSDGALQLTCFSTSELPRCAKYDFASLTSATLPGSTAKGASVGLKQAVKPIAWKYCDYPVAPSHFLTSASPETLDATLRDVFRREHISFEMETRDSLRYICRKTVDSAVYSFTVLVSSLLKSCQGLLDNKYVVEVVRNRTCGFAEPGTWRHVTCAVLGSLGAKFDDSNEDDTEQPPLDDEIVSLSENHDVVSDITKADDDFDPVQSFLRIYKQSEPNVESEFMSEMLLHASQQMVSAGKVLRLQDQGLNAVQGLLYKGSTHFKSCTCLIIENVARCGGLQNSSQEDVNNLFRELLRLLFMYEGDADAELQLGALRALSALKQVAQPSEVDRILVEKAVSRFREKEDDRLQDAALHLANNYQVQTLVAQES